MSLPSYTQEILAATTLPPTLRTSPKEAAAKEATILQNAAQLFIQVANVLRSHYTDEKPHIIAYLDSRCIRLWLTQVVFVVYHSSLCIIVAA